MILRTRRLPTVRICLLIVGIALWSVTVAPAASAGPFRAVDSPNLRRTASSLAGVGLSAPVARPVSKRRSNRSESAMVRHARCAGAARAGKHHKASKLCAVKKSNVSGTKRSVARKRLSSKPTRAPSLASPSTQAPLGSGGPPTEASQEPGSEFGPAPESPSESTTPAAPNPPVEPIPPVEPGSPVEPSAPFRFFAVSSFWNVPVPADAPLDPSSAAVVGALAELVAEEEQSRGGPWINTTKYSVPVYKVPGDQPAVPVQLVDHNPNAALSSAWSAVPLPPEARPSAGTDGALVVWQPSTDRLWEFWRLGYGAGGWHASWGGAMQNVSSNAGVYGPEAWPGAETWWGVSASSLSLVGGLISLEDLEKGQIDHALSMSIPDARAGVYASPAQRSDGKSSDPLSLPEGAHLRLDPSLDLAALHLPRVTLMIAEAAQRYGIFIRDYAGVVTFQAQDPIPTGTNPYTGPGGYFEGQYPRGLLASFPWDHLELLKMELHSN